jgi:hypothetical protein
MITKGIVFYTNNIIDPLIIQAVQKQLLRSGLPIVSVSLKPMDFGQNIVLPLESAILSMFKQQLAGIEACETDVIFLCEHDMIYHPSHFDFTPETDNFWYNENSWKIRIPDGQALFYTCKQTGFCCARRSIILDHYRNRVKRVEEEGFRRYNGFEPGTHPVPRGYCNYGAKEWMSPVPNLDIRHSTNLTWSRWDQKHFRRKPQNWQMADEIPWWGKTKDHAMDILNAVANDGFNQ